MGKKIYFRNSSKFIAMASWYFAMFLVLPITFLIFSFALEGPIGVKILFSIYTPIGIWLFYEEMSYRIVLKNDIIFVPNKTDNGKLIQKKTEIKYSDICDISIFGDVTFAEGEKPVWKDFAPSLFLDIKLKNGKRRKIWLLHFSKTSIIKIIDEISLRMKNCGNVSLLVAGKEMIQQLNSNKSKQFKE